MTYSIRTLAGILLALMVAVPVFAQDQDETPTVDLLAALESVRAEYGDDVIVLSAELDTEDADDMDDEDTDDIDDADDNENCADFEILTAEGEQLDLDVCLDAETGELLVTLDDANDMDDNNDDDNDDDNSSSNDDNDDDNDDDDEDSDDISAELLETTLTVTLEDAIASALEIFPNATIIEIELEIEDGTLVWDIDVRIPSSDETRSVDIDADTGSVLQFGFESADDDANRLRDNDDDDDDDNDARSDNDDNDDDNSSSNDDDDDDNDDDDDAEDDNDDDDDSDDDDGDDDDDDDDGDDD